MSKLDDRRKAALDRLKMQLIRGSKRDKEGKEITLSEKDIKRISKEVNILEEKIKV
jgi:hypothetical protein